MRYINIRLLLLLLFQRYCGFVSDRFGRRLESFLAQRWHEIHTYLYRRVYKTNVAIPVRTKTGRNVTEAFEKILEDGKPNMVQSDKGTEFLNSTFQSMLQRHNIKFYTSENEDLKAAVVERFNRTLKTKMFRYFTYKNTRRYQT